eukprot:8908588-Pyramimonas_sp.AAC.1
MALHLAESFPGASRRLDWHASGWDAGPAVTSAPALRISDPSGPAPPRRDLGRGRGAGEAAGFPQRVAAGEARGAGAGAT